MTDINTFASEVTEIQEQKKPIRISIQKLQQ